MPKDENIDAFWDIEDMLPKRTKKEAVRRMTADTSAVEIALENESAQTEIAIPPKPKPSDPQPMQTRRYTKETGLIRNVLIKPWPAIFGFYEKFKKDALRNFNRTHEPCEYVYFFSYMPQYEQMTVSQMAYYLYWRGEIRKNIYLKTDINYLFLYAYEIINLPEKIPPSEGAILLSRLWSAYRDDFHYLDKYLGEWLCDYCLLHNVSPDWQVLNTFYKDISGKISLPEFYLNDSTLPFSLISAIASYDYTKSKYYEEHRDAYDRHIPAAMERAVNKILMKELSHFGISLIKTSRDSFSGAIACHAMKFKIELDYYAIRRAADIKPLFSNMIKLCENQLRGVFGIKSRFSPSGVDERLKNEINAYFDEQYSGRNNKKTFKAEDSEEAAYLALYEPKQNGPADISRALAIEEQAWETASLLSTDEDEETEIETETLTPPADEPSELPNTDFSFELSDDFPSGDFDFIKDVLSEEQQKALTCALNGTFVSYCRSIGKMAEQMRGEINETAMEYIGDILIESDFTVIEDYMEDIKHELEA